MKVLILGVAGMAGHVIYTVLKEETSYEILGTVNVNKFDRSNRQFNIYDLPLLDQLLKEFKPDIVINCIGVLIKGSKSFPDNAIYANSFIPHYLSRKGKELNFKLIHISTDCVFTGNEGAYTEDSIKDAADIYGLSKSLGEVIDDRNITIRTSIIGPEIKKDGEGLFDWFLHQENKIYGFKSNIWSGVTTLELARFIKWLIAAEHELTGLYHLTNNIPISKFDLLSLINRVYKRNIVISDEKDYVSNKSFRNTRNDLNFQVRSYEEMLRDQKDFMEKHKDFYSYNL